MTVVSEPFNFPREKSYSSQGSIEMYVTFGKHSGKSAEMLVLKHPDYVLWVLRVEFPTAHLLQVRQELMRLIKIFNLKPIVVPCRGEGCEETATRGSVCRGAVWPSFWCDGCDPYQLGASSGKLRIVRFFGDAIDHVNTCCGARKEALRILIKELARARGLPTRVGEQQAEQFFA
jgi:uncharacterized protein (DUF3820 family)